VEHERTHLVEVRLQSGVLGTLLFDILLGSGTLILNMLLLSLLL